MAKLNVNHHFTILSLLVVSPLSSQALLHVSELTDDPDVMKHPEGNAGVVRSLTALGMKVDLECLDVDRVRGWVKMSRKSVVKKGLNEGEKYTDPEMFRAKEKAIREYAQEGDKE